MGRPSSYEAVLNVLDQSNGSIEQQTATLFNTNLSKVKMQQELRQVLAAIYIDFGLESLRAVEAMETAARLAAAMAGRQTVLMQDIIMTAPLILGHRVDNASLTNIMKYLDTIKDKSGAAIQYQPQALAPDITEDKVESTDDAQAPVRKSFFLQDWWALIVRKLRLQPPTVSGGKIAATKGGQAKVKHNSALPLFCDPLQPNIIAPPKSAQPLATLPLDQYVNSEEPRSNG